MNITNCIILSKMPLNYSGLRVDSKTLPPVTKQDVSTHFFIKCFSYEFLVSAAGGRPQRLLNAAWRSVKPIKWEEERRGNAG